MMNVTEIVKHCRVTEQRNINISKVSTPRSQYRGALHNKMECKYYFNEKKATVANFIALSKKDIHNFLPGVRSPPKSF